MRTLTSPLYLAKGVPLLFQPGIRRYVILPILINFAVFSLFIWVGFSQLSDMLDHYIATLPDWLQWIDWILAPLILICLVAIGSFICLIFANLIAAPFNSFLAEALLRQLTPSIKLPDGGFAAIAKNIVPELMSELKKLGYITIRALPLLLLFIIPGINIFAPILWILFSAWVLALEYLEFPMSSHGMLFDKIRARLGRSRLATLSFGGSIVLLTVIPVINFFIMPIAVAGACVFYAEQLIEENRDR